MFKGLLVLDFALLASFNVSSFVSGAQAVDTIVPIKSTTVNMSIDVVLP